jgi:hypothetical protein
MLKSPLSKTLLKIFAVGFYRVHGGLLMVVFFILLGLVEPGQWFNYEKTLILAFVSSPIFMLVVFIVWLLYTVKAIHYVSGQIAAVNQQFLFYSSNALSRGKQFKSWLGTQIVILLPIIIYGLLAVFAGLVYHYYLSALVILLYMALLIAGSAAFYVRQVNLLVDGSKQSFILKISAGWHKPFFSLFIYHVFDKLKVNYLVTKVLSWIIITAVFYLFADVSTDLRIAGIAMLGIITAHVVIIYQQHSFEQTYLSFARNMPYSYIERFLNFAGVYFVLLLPECIWLFTRFNPVTAMELTLLGLSIMLLFHCLIYNIGLSMDKYLQWVIALFVFLFWVVMFKIVWVLILLNVVVAYVLFYRKYYAVG